MIEALKLFDSYNRQARLYPALLALLPAALTALAWFSQLLTGSVGGALVTVVAMRGGLYLLAEVARTAGKKLNHPVAGWGGWSVHRNLQSAPCHQGSLTTPSWGRSLSTHKM